MKIIKKLDKSNRVCITAEVRDFLGWNINDELELETTSDNKIILSRVENSSKDDLVTQETNSRLSDILNVVGPMVNIKEKPKVESKIESKIESKVECKDTEDTEDLEDPLDKRLCHQCKKPIEKSRFIYNHGYICKECKDKIKDRLMRDIILRKMKLKEENDE